MSRFFLLAVLLSLLSFSSGQTLCVKYATALFGADNSTTEFNLVSAVVGRAVLGGSFNNVTVDGIAQSPTTSGQTNPIIGYFNGQVNFRQNPNNPDYTRNGFNNTDFATLAAHLYSYFGALLGCNYIGQGSFGPVATSDMYGVHANMNLNQNQMTYFDTAVANSLTSFGAASADVTAAGGALGYFNRCGGYITGNQFISATARNQICDAGSSSCPTLATNANCTLYSSGATSTATVSVMVLATLVAVVSMLL